MNKVLISIIWLYSFSPLCFNLHVRSPSIAILHNDLQYEITEWFCPKSPNDFSKSPTTISPNKFLQISKASAKRFSPKSPNSFLQNHRTVFSKIAERFSQKSPNGFSKTPTKFYRKSPNTCSPNHQTHFLQIANVSRHMFSQNRRTLYSKSPRYFVDQRPAYFLFCSLRRRPSL